MQTKAVRMYGEMDIRLERFDLPDIKEDEILVKVVSDSICMSTYKLLQQGKNHKRAPENIATHPIIIGHEMAGDIVKVGKKWQNQFKEGQRFALQPALNYKGSLASPGYSYEYFGGASTYCILPQEVMELGCLMVYEGDGYYQASLAEPMSCIVGGFNAVYHTNKKNYVHEMGIKENGNVLVMGGCGPMGLGAIAYLMQSDKHPKRVVVTDLSDDRINHAKKVLSVEDAKEKGIELVYHNPSTDKTPLIDYTDGKGYDDAFVYVPVASLIEEADSLLAFDGCLNFFAGPTDHFMKAKINAYNVHYMNTKVMGSTGGNNDDLIESLNLFSRGKIDPAVMVTHIGGMDAIVDTCLNLPQIPGGKKLMYTHIDLPLTAIADFEALGVENPLFKELHEITSQNRGLWNAKAERVLLDYYKV